MGLRHFEFLLQETLTGIRRNAFMSAAAVSTIAVSLLLLGVLQLLTANLDHVARSLGGRFEMRAYLNTQVVGDQRDALRQQVAALPGVASCRLVTKEEALPELARRMGGAVPLADLRKDNPLPDALVIRVADPARMGAVADAVKGLDGVDEVVDTRDAARIWSTVTRAVHVGGAGAVALLMAAAAIIVGSTIQLTVHARRLEIGIMQLVGATNSCVRTPFLLEGAFHGAFGALLALAALAAGYSHLYREFHAVQGSVPFLELVPPTLGLFTRQIAVLAGTGVALGLASSYLSVRRYLRI